MSMLEDLRRWQRLIADLPEPIAYLVIDAACPTNVAAEGRDAHGRKWALFPANLLDEVVHTKLWGIPVLATDLVAPGSFGTPLYRREDMPEGWPDA